MFLPDPNTGIDQSQRLFCTGYFIIRDENCVALQRSSYSRQYKHFTNTKELSFIILI